MSLIPKKGTVYVVDDDEAVRDSLQWLLEGKDYRVRCFDSAETFLSRYEPREIACLIVDIRMGGMTGIELAVASREVRPSLPILLATGYAELPQGEAAGIPKLAKPFRQQDLAAIIDEAMALAPTAIHSARREA